MVVWQIDIHQLEALM